MMYKVHHILSTWTGFSVAALYMYRRKTKGLVTCTSERMDEATVDEVKNGNETLHQAISQTEHTMETLMVILMSSYK